MNRVLHAVMLAALLAGCANPTPTPQPIDTGKPVEFQHRSGVFKLQVPDAWAKGQDEAPTEALGIFTDPTGQASIMAYAGLLDRRLGDDEGLTTVGKLASTLLSQPDDYQVADRRRRPDGAFEVTFTFKRGEQKFAGRAIFRDTDLALSGVTISGPEQSWPDLDKALAVYADSFQIVPEVMQGSYFVPLEGQYYILVVPSDWPQQRTTDGGAEVRSRNQRLSILLLQQDLGAVVEPAALAEQAAKSLRQSFPLAPKLKGNEKLADGRLKVTLDQGDDRIVGYVEQFDTHIVGLFFKVPAERVADYQPFMDFVYSTYISGLP